MNTIPKRRSNRISILIVPEDNAEPYSFRLKTSVVKVLYVLGAMLVVHMVIGFIFYWKYAKLNDFNDRLLAYNAQLQEDNKRVIALSDQFYALENQYKKVRTLLEVDFEPKTSGELKAQANEQKLFDNIVPAVKRDINPRLSFLENTERFFLSPRKSRVHSDAENVPTLLPVKGFLTQGFLKNGWFGPKHHTGIDIVAKTGTIIRAAASGTIIFADWTYDLGKLIIIDHGGGMMSYYGHNQRILKPEKSYVKKGDPIALLGNTGKSSGPHLHFEIWENGIPVDPMDYVLALNENIATHQ